MNSQLTAVHSNVLFSEFNMVLHIKGPVMALTAPDYVNDDDNDDHDEAHFYLFATVFVCTSLFCIHSFICIHLKISLLCHHHAFIISIKFKFVEEKKLFWSHL